MLTVTFAAAGLFAIVFAIPPEWGAPLLNYGIRLTIPLAVVGIVYGRGYVRAFAIGAAAYLGLPMLFQEQSGQVYNTIFNSLTVDLGPNDRIPVLTRLLMAGLSGLIGVGARWCSLPASGAGVESRPAPAGEPVLASERPEARERLPAWLVPVFTLLLLVGGMIGWLGIESGRWAQNPFFATTTPPPGFFPATTAPAVWSTPIQIYPGQAIPETEKSEDESNSGQLPSGPPAGVP
jgi:hypothetical protein